MTNLRDLARGQPCMIRIPGVCNGNQETTVLAHYRMAGICGTGQKPPDECGAWACSSCHDFVDRRVPPILPYSQEAEDVGRWHMEGVLRTLHELSRLGYKMKKV